MKHQSWSVEISDLDSLCSGHYYKECKGDRDTQPSPEWFDLNDIRVKSGHCISENIYGIVDDRIENMIIKQILEFNERERENYE